MGARRLSPADRSSAEAVQQQQHSSKAVDMQRRFVLMGDRLERRWLERCGNMELTFAMVCLCDPTAQGHWPLTENSLVTELVTSWRPQVYDETY